jgi:hypothetical protein
MAAVTCLGHAPVRAADGPGNEALKTHGLKMAGSIAVSDLEADVKSKLNEARRLSKLLSQSLMEQQGTLNPKDQQRNIKQLNEQIGQLKSELNAVNQQMAQIPRNNSQFGAGYGGGMGGYGGTGIAGYAGRFGNAYGNGYGAGAGGANSFANNNAAEAYGELLAYRNQLQEELNQDSMFLKELQNRVVDPKAKDKIDSEVKKRREGYQQSLTDLRKVVDQTTDKYEELAKNDEVTKALKLVGKGLREKPKLGPSREFINNVKLVEKLEKAAAAGDPEEPQTTKARRARGKTKGKSSSKAASTAAAGRTSDDQP